MSLKKQAPSSVYIEATNGELFTADKWTGNLKPNSVVVIQDEVQFRIALTQPSNKGKICSSYSSPLENYMTGIIDEEQAKLDMKSVENTDNIRKLEKSTTFAAGYCNAYLFPDGKTKGLLPALGWWQTAYDNKAAVDACLAACGATPMDTSNYHWASTLWGVSGSDRDCWVLSWSDGSVSPYYLDGSLRVRPFAAY